MQTMDNHKFIKPMHLILCKLRILLKTSLDFKDKLTDHLTMFQFLITRHHPNSIDHLEVSKFLLSITVFYHVLIVINHQYKAVLLDLDKFKAVKELSVNSIEVMSLVIILASKFPIKFMTMN